MKRGKFVIKQSVFSKKKVRYYWWVYVAPNGEIVCSSQVLGSRAACKKGIRSVKRGFMSRVVVNEDDK